MTVSLLEQRRREARQFDEQQRQAEARASEALVSKPRVVLTPPTAAPMSDQGDRLSSLLLGDTNRLVTVEDLHAVISYFDEQLDELRADLESAETGYEPL